MNIISLLRKQASERPNQAAIIQSRRGEDQTITFSELDRAAETGAAFLANLGLLPGDSVLVFQPMSIELYEILLAIFRSGLVAMFLDPSAGPEHLKQCCAINSPSAFIGSAKAHVLLVKSRTLRKIPRRIVPSGWLPGSVSWRNHRSMISLPKMELPSADAPALLTFTSGSTGAPKAAVRTHRFLLAQHKALEASISLDAGEVDLTTLPIFVLANLASGITSVIPDADLRSIGRIDAGPVLEQIRRLNITRMAGSPAFFERLAETCEISKISLPSFQKIYTGGAPVFPNLLTRLQKLAPKATITAVYGSTEAEPIAHISLNEIQPGDFARMAEGGGLLAGAVVPEIQLRILHERWGKPIGPFSIEGFETATVSRGEIGEICVTGEHVLKGYFQGRGNHETKFEVEGVIWHRTGDAGYLDEKNRLWLMGRCVARVKDSRGVVYPFSVECVAQQFEEVRRCAFVSVNDRRILVVELTRDHTQLPTRLRETLKWVDLDELRVVREIPVDKRHNAKVDYPRLLTRLAEGNAF